MTSISQVELGWASGDRPGALEFAQPVPYGAACAIADVLAPHLQGLSPARISALEPVSDPVGRFRAVDDGGIVWFLRITRRRTAVEIEKAVLDHLESEGVAVNPLRLAGLVLPWNGEELRLDVRPYVEGAHFSGGDEELISLGRTLAECHVALARYDGAAGVYAAAVRRASRLEEMRGSVRQMLVADQFDELGEAAPWAGANRSWLRAFVDAFDPWMPLRPGAQCVHGEVHAGNVLFAQGRAILLDFEEATHVFAPTAWDLGYAVQRFCLAGGPTLAVVGSRIACLRRGYGASLPSLAEPMRQIAWHMAAVVFATWMDERLVTPKSEFAKFVRLTDEVERYQSILLDATF